MLNGIGLPQCPGGGEASLWAEEVAAEGLWPEEEWCEVTRVWPPGRVAED